MATNPRPGIINLDFADVSEQARRIAANDPLRLGLQAAGTGIDMLAERDRQLAYRRQMAAKDGVELTPEQRGTTTREGLGKATDWIGEQAGIAGKNIGQLFAPPSAEPTVQNTQVPPPFSKDIVMDKSSTPLIQGEQTDADPFDIQPRNMSIAPTMSKLTAPPSEDQMVLNERVQFPTTVVPAPVSNQSEKKISGTTVDKSSTTADGSHEFTSPNLAWSEMYRLNPDRATFDWNRVAPKGSGAAGTVQARLEHDAALDQQIAGLTTALRKDMLANGWKTTSPEFLDRYAEIDALEAQKFIKRDKNGIAKLIGMGDTEFTQAQATDKFAFDKEKQQTDIDKNAYAETKEVFDNLMDKRYSTPATYDKIATDLKLAAETGNEAAIKEAVKGFIQSIDNSVVMSFEAKSFADQSTLGGLRQQLQGLIDDNIYSPERLAEIWDVMGAYIGAYNKSIDNLSTKGQKLYGSHGGKKPQTIAELANTLKATDIGKAPDFSVKVKPWYDKVVNDIQSEQGGSIFNALMGNTPTPAPAATPAPVAPPPPPKNKANKAKKDEPKKSTFNMDDY